MQLAKSTPGISELEDVGVTISNGYILTFSFIYHVKNPCKGHPI